MVTMTAVGTVKLGLLLLNETVLQPLDGVFSVTVHVADAPGDKMAGVQVTEVGEAPATRLMVALAELPFIDAVSWAD